MKTKPQQLEEGKAKRRTGKDFSHLKPNKVDKVYELMFNGRLYRNANKKALLKDIGTIENGRPT